MVLVHNLVCILVGTYICPLVLAKGFFLFLLILSHIDHRPVFLLFSFCLFYFDHIDGPQA